MSDTLAGLTRDAFGLFDAAMRAAQRPADAPRPSSKPGTPGPGGGTPGAAGPASASPSTASKSDAPGPGHSDDGPVVVGSGVGWPTAVHPQHQHDEPADERGHREEGGEPGDGDADGGTDEQVERPAE